MLTAPFKGAGYLFRGIGLITQPGVRAFVLIPLLINVVLFAGALWYANAHLGDLEPILLGMTPDWLHWLVTPLMVVLYPVFWLAALLLIFYTFTLVANVIAAPFNGLLSEKVELLLTGQPIEVDGDWKKLMKSLVPMILAELRKLLYFLLRAIPALILSIFIPFIWLIFGSWMLAVDYVDYPLGNHGKIFPANVDVLRKRRFMSLGFGGMVSVLAIIPVLNFITVPAAVAGATAMWVEQFNKEDN